MTLLFFQVAQAIFGACWSPQAEELRMLIAFFFQIAQAIFRGDPIFRGVAHHARKFKGWSHFSRGYPSRT